MPYPWLIADENDFPDQSVEGQLNHGNKENLFIFLLLGLGELLLFQGFRGRFLLLFFGVVGFHRMMWVRC
jgi:hypothetical protein